MDWSVILDYSSTDLNDAIELIKLIRKINFNLLIKLTTEQFNYTGIHTTKGEISLEKLVNMYCQHVEQHFNQMKRNIL